MRSVKVVLTTAILVAATASGLAREDAAGGAAAHGPGGESYQPPAGQHGASPSSDHAADSDDLPSVPRQGSPVQQTVQQVGVDSETAGPHGTSARAGSGPKAVLRSTPARPRLALGPARPVPDAEPKKPSAWIDFKANDAISKMVGGLAIVLGVFLLFAWAVRKRLPKGSARLPDEIIEVLGRTTLAAKQSLHLVRVGGKLIVVSVTATGTETLTEITDPGEVARILAACQQHHIHSSSTAFRQVFEQLGREPASGFLSGQSGRAQFSREGSGAA